jgi:type III secretion protein N (ATPase)
VAGEVAGFSDRDTLVVPYGPLDGLGRDARVFGTGACLRIPLGPGLLGCVIDPLGRVLQGRLGAACPERPLPQTVPDPFDRLQVTKQLVTGVRTLDTLVPLGEGQRMGVFAAAGSGKTTLLGMLARGCGADVIVIGLIGERGREVRDFIENNLGEEGMRRSVVVAATSDRSALERIKCAFVATSIAEHFRDQGQRVLLLMDSLTRFARAQRELGLALGEPPTRRGFPPSLFALLPQLLERPGRTHKGSISALYTVLMEDENLTDPVAEEVKSLLDGHVYLSPKISGRGIYPAIDIRGSLSRLQGSLRSAEQLKVAERARGLWNRYLDVELLIQMGEYKPGHDAATDEAVQKYPALCEFLKQDERVLEPAADSEQRMRELLR